MKMKTLGRTGLQVTENSFGALPIQRISDEDAVALLRYAYDSGINFYDTARFYTDSEHKIGLALSDVRENIIIATKSMGRTKSAALADLEISLGNLKTDYVDIFQLHNVTEAPDLDDPESSYYALIEAKKSGKCRYIGITTHRLDLALQFAKSKLYDTVQFPLCYMSAEKDLELIEVCKEHNIGLIAMKGMSGGIISSPEAAFAFFTQYDNVVPIWGVQKKCELDDFLGYAEKGVVLDERLNKVIAEDREKYSADFCRGCGYCEPCPAGVPLRDAARMIPMLNRAPWKEYTTEAWQEKMSHVKDCIDCGRCESRCPYQLNCRRLIRESYDYFIKVCREKGVLIEKYL